MSLDPTADPHALLWGGSWVVEIGPDGRMTKEETFTVDDKIRIVHTVDGVSHIDTLDEIHEWDPPDPTGGSDTPAKGPTGGGGGGVDDGGGGDGGDGGDEEDPGGPRCPWTPPDGDDTGPGPCTDPHYDPLSDLLDVWGATEDAVHVATGAGYDAVPGGDDAASTDTSGDDDYGKDTTGVETPDHISGPEPTGDDTGEVPGLLGNVVANLGRYGPLLLVTSQADGPEPGPADLIAFGIVIWAAWEALHTEPTGGVTCTASGYIRDCPEAAGPFAAPGTGANCQECCANGNRNVRSSRGLPVGCNWGHFQCQCPA